MRCGGDRAARVAPGARRPGARGSSVDLAERVGDDLSKRIPFGHHGGLADARTDGPRPLRVALDSTRHAC